MKAMEQGAVKHAREPERLSALSYIFDFTRNGGELSGWRGQVTPFGYWRIANKGGWGWRREKSRITQRRVERREGAEKRAA
jgi:hypothetical protein